MTNKPMKTSKYLPAALLFTAQAFAQLLCTEQGMDQAEACAIVTCALILAPLAVPSLRGFYARVFGPMPKLSR
jgi:hypothetical protein